MKDVENVSLAGSVFALEVDARHAVNAYLHKTETALGDIPASEKAELMKDFEASIAGHLHDLGYSRDKAASKDVVNEILSKMGDPQEERDKQESAQPGIRFDFLKEPFTLSKTNRVIFGLCGAVAERMQIDAIWLRLLMVFLAFVTHGGIFFAYLIVGIVLSVIEDETKPGAKAILEASEKARQAITQTGWRGVFNRAGTLVQRALRITFGAIFGVLFLICLAMAQIWLVAMLRKPALDMWLIGYNRSVLAYIFVGSIAFGALLFTGTLFKQVVFPAKKPLSTLGIVVALGIVTLLASAAITSGVYLRQDMSDWAKRHPNNGFIDYSSDGKGNYEYRCLSLTGGCYQEDTTVPADSDIQP